MITWVIQSSVPRSAQTQMLMDALEELDIPYAECAGSMKVYAKAPFMTPDRANSIIPYGSTQLEEIAREAKWRHHYYDPATFNMAVACEKHPLMLNCDSLFITLSNAKQIVKPEEKYFIRPLSDLKEFHGHVLTGQEIIDWVTRLEKGDCDFNGNLPIVLGRPAEIRMEWRYFIVDSKIVTGSSYRYNGQPHRERETDIEVLEEAQLLADMWLPSPCCVMDVALCDNIAQVVEFNCINASGFYDHDVKAFAETLTNYARKQE